MSGLRGLSPAIHSRSAEPVADFILCEGNNASIWSTLLPNTCFASFSTNLPKRPPCAEKPSATVEGVSVAANLSEAVEERGLLEKKANASE